MARVLITFAAAFRRVPKSKMGQREEACPSRQPDDLVHLFDISLEIKEEDNKVLNKKIKKSKWSEAARKHRLW